MKRHKANCVHGSPWFVDCKMCETDEAANRYRNGHHEPQTGRFVERNLNVHLNGRAPIDAGMPMFELFKRDAHRTIRMGHAIGHRTGLRTPLFDGTPEGRNLIDRVLEDRSHLTLNQLVSDMLHLLEIGIEDGWNHQELHAAEQIVRLSRL